MQFVCPECGHKFKVSKRRLLFSGGTSRDSIPDYIPDLPPIPRESYHLKCPKCNKRSWVSPIQQRNYSDA